MAKIRDFQRQKVYDWERAQFGDWPLREMGDLQQIAHDVVADYDLPRISLTDGRGRRRAALRYHRPGDEPARLEYRPIVRAVDGRGERICDIALPKWARSVAVLCHELAHYIVAQVYGKNGVAVHGPEMVRIMLDLLAHYCSEDFHGLLASALLDGRVKVADCVPVAPDGQPRKVNRRAGVVAGAVAAEPVAPPVVRWECGQDTDRLIVDGELRGRVERKKTEGEPLYYGFRLADDGEWYLAATFSDRLTTARSVERQIKG